LAEYDPNYIYADEDVKMAESGEDEGWGSGFESDDNIDV